MMTTVAELLDTRRQLEAVSDSPGLDVAVLLCHCLDKPRSYLYAYPEAQLDPAQVDHFQELLQRRLAGEPVAHLTGRREFWSLDLAVNSSTLIPRPDTESLVECALSRCDRNAELAVLDLGTGTGAVALALASECPRWSLTGVDRVADAVTLAQYNARELELGNICFLQSDWFAELAGQRFDLIVGNPPYIDERDPHLDQGDVRFEPRSALVAADGGLADIAAIVAAAPQHLESRGWLMLEHGYRQGEAVRRLFYDAGFRDVETLRDLGELERITIGRWSKE